MVYRVREAVGFFVHPEATVRSGSGSRVLARRPAGRALRLRLF
jgi:hypothetical protein